MTQYVYIFIKHIRFLARPKIQFRDADQGTNQRNTSMLRQFITKVSTRQLDLQARQRPYFQSAHLLSALVVKA